VYIITIGSRQRRQRARRRSAAPSHSALRVKPNQNLPIIRTFRHSCCGLFAPASRVFSVPIESERRLSFFLVLTFSSREPVSTLVEGAGGFRVYRSFILLH
jgi:hypothetical protein